MAHQYSKDLFEETKMSFGEHLEELRAALLKGLAALVLGFLVGLLFGNWVVAWLQEPLRNSLERYYQARASERYERLLLERKKRGESTPEDLKEAVRIMADDALAYEEVYIHSPAVFEELKRKYPETFRDVTLPVKVGQGLSKEDLLRLFLWRPIQDDARIRIQSLSAQEAFMIYIKASLLFGAVIASPFIFYFLWSFVAAGLYPHEKKYVHIFLPMSIGLFLAGASLAFFAVFRYVLDFLFGFNAWLGIDPNPRISEWLSFALLLPIGFGVSFQLPLVMLFLERIGVFNIEVYLAKWRIAVLVIAIISMLLTPSDPMSMLLMAIPLVILYFGGIGLCRALPRSSNPFPDAID